MINNKKSFADWILIYSIFLALIIFSGILLIFLEDYYNQPKPNLEIQMVEYFCWETLEMNERILNPNDYSANPYETYANCINFNSNPQK